MVVEADSGGMPVARYKEIPEMPLSSRGALRTPVIEEIGPDGQITEYVFLDNAPFKVDTEAGIKEAAGTGVLVALATGIPVRFGPRVGHGRHNENLDILPRSVQPGVGAYIPRSEVPVGLLVVGIFKSSLPQNTRAINQLSILLKTEEGRQRATLLAQESVSLLPRPQQSS